MEQKVEFTPEQQEKITALIQEAQGRAAKEIKSQLETANSELATLKEKLTTLQAEENKQKGPNPELDNKLKEAERLISNFQLEIANLKNVAKDKEAEASSAKEKQREFERLWALEKAAGNDRFIDLSLIIKDTKDQVKWDDTYKKYVVTNEDGGVRLNKMMEPMTLEEFYEEYASKKPWAVNPLYKGGTGATKSSGPGGKYKVEEIFGKDASAAKAQKLYKESPADYQRLKAQARELGLL